MILTNGFNNAPKINDGKKMAIVEISAPENPLIWKQIKVTDEKTGPGVNCPTAIASINCVLNKKPVATNSASRNAKTARMM